MIFDWEDQVCRNQAFAATAVSGSSIDTFSAGSDLSMGRRMAFVVAPAVSAGAGSTHVLAAIQADDEALTSNVQVLGQIQVLAADLIKGSKFEIPIPQGSKTKRYLGIRDTITGGTTTVTLDAWLVPQDEIDKYKSFPKVVNADNN